ncbi:DNA-binding domain-containing protein [Shewanella sp. D64]|uniref:HvfC/BufC N-terminal domain-containing protein n=1 Tax=unclassified Shewanella TaxID=196818 RepID=UPI0022BA577E|nr:MULTISPECIES: DNA-binding domain-containing protein [unclassified Shewanella]MEC4726229.1 DNA-binding domain-containing protein [Shewanella sp. D64]MEC4738241.1 DNA-binding domain-containing protein [Shewanella sp. E94]WBJ95382.1 DNA-binding domain-containing protein [Shewanella sp. MTB7]
MRLAEWQDAFVNALREEGHDKQLLAMVNAREINRLSVYRNNSKQALMAAMRATFPISESILGETCFEQLAQNYQQHYPLKVSDLNQYGESFPLLIAEIITTHSEFEGVNYLADLAQLEWLLQLSYYAGDGLVCSPFSQLEFLCEDQQADAVMLLRPDIKLLSSSYPLYELWIKYQEGKEAVDISDPVEIYHFCVYRDPFKPKVQRIAPELYQILVDITLSRTLDQISESGSDMAALNWAISKGWVCGFHCEGLQC